ncbi:hypothetical protein Tco_0548988 [Tanacetum coccineum]
MNGCGGLFFVSFLVSTGIWLGGGVIVGVIGISILPLITSGSLLYVVDSVGLCGLAIWIGAGSGAAGENFFEFCGDGSSNDDGVGSGLIVKSSGSTQGVKLKLECMSSSFQLFEGFREIAESVWKIEEFRRLCVELRANIRLRNDCFSKLRLYRSCDDILGTIKMLRRMQLDDTENAARLFSMARDT